MDPTVQLPTRGRIGAQVLWDYMVRPIAREDGDVPWGPRGLSQRWLTGAMCKNTPSARVESFRVEAGHQGSNIRRALRVAYNEAGRAAGLPTHLYIKCTPTLLTRLGSGIGAAGEAKFFTLLRRELSIEAPVQHHSAYDRRTGRSMHIFEDLVVTKAATFCSPSTYISRDRAEQMVETLAALHGHFYGAHHPLLHQFISYETWFKGGERAGIKGGHDRAMVEAQDVIPDDVLERKEEIWSTALRVLGVHDKEPRTLLHSDVHLGNWYVTGDGRMGLADWGCVAVGHWSRDLAYMISTSLEVEDRRTWERDLLGRYLAQMRESCGLDVSFDVAWERYRQQLCAALLMWTPTLCHPPTMPDMQPTHVSRELIRRMTAAISDLKALDCEGVA